MIVATASVSLWISNTATAVMMMPIGLALVRDIEIEGGKGRLASFGAAIMLAVAYASNVGGIGTKIGTGTNSIFVGFVSTKLGRDIGFLEYALVGLPFVCLFLPIVWMVLWRIARRDGLAETRGRDAIAHELASLGPMSRAEMRVALVFAGAAAAWIFADPIRRALIPLMRDAGVGGFALLGKHVEATIAIVAAVSLIALRVLSFRALRRAPWGTLVLLGGSFSLAAGIEGSGLGGIVAGALAGVRDFPLFAQIAVASLATVLLSAVASNTATINVMLNVLPPALPVLTASAIGASCDFMLPAGTPPNAIVFGSGYIRLPTMIRTGFALDLIAIGMITLYCYAFVPLVL
jgi:sodium-dependent dicarboxylate transporter 2/3/5